MWKLVVLSIGMVRCVGGGGEGGGTGPRGVGKIVSFSSGAGVVGGGGDGGARGRSRGR